MTARWFLRLAVALSCFPRAASVIAADWYAAPDGSSARAGSKKSPWDIDSALGDETRLKASPLPVSLW